MTVWLWIVFLAVVLGLLALDLGVFHRRAHAVRVSEAAVWTTAWVILALLFNGAVYFLYEHHVFGIGREIGHDLGGEQAALQFSTGYIVEKSPSLDNVFVTRLLRDRPGTPRPSHFRFLRIIARQANVLRIYWPRNWRQCVTSATPRVIALAKEDALGSQLEPPRRSRRRCQMPDDARLSRMNVTRGPSLE